MNFHIDNLFIWLKNGKKRTINFLPNKVNIVTGSSNTGKTAILDIFDYCFFSSKHKISESMINENAEWYGIRFSIGGKKYTIARKAPVGRVVSSDYFFSSVGDVPKDAPVSNNTETALKLTLGAEFGIDQDTTVSYGGNTLKANSKISLRYFLMFNTVSQDIITHSEQFFDKQTEARYREALPRTFDLAVGIDTVENILKREKRQELEKKLKRLERESSKREDKQDLFQSELAGTIKKAKEYALVQESEEVGSAVEQLERMISEQDVHGELDAPTRYEELAAEINQVSRKIRTLKHFAKEYANYKENLKVTSDSLRPISFLSENYSQLVKTSIYDEIVSALESDQKEIKLAIKNKTPIDSNTSDLIKNLEKEKKKLEEEQLDKPEQVASFRSEREKYIFIGEVKAKLNLYAKRDAGPLDDSSGKIETVKSQIADLHVTSVEEQREVFVSVLNETIQEYIAQTSAALENYGSYRSSFNYTEKRLQLRKPKTQFIENVGSSSNHMFLHLFLFLGLHELILDKDNQHVPPFLIIDQFSRPYWGEAGKEKDELNQTDISKVKSALSLLNQFVRNANDHGKNFQMIIFEHINKDLWSEMENITLVEDFRGGNALIPESMLS